MPIKSSATDAIQTENILTQSYSRVYDIQVLK